MDLNKCREMRKRIDSALADIACSETFTLKLGRITFSGDGFRSTIVAEEVSDGELPTRYKTDWNEAVEAGAVKAEHFGVITTDRNGKQFEVVGFDWKKRKYNILLQGVIDGKIYKTTISHFLKAEFREINMAQAKTGNKKKMVPAGEGDCAEIGGLVEIPLKDVLQQKT